MALLRLAPDVVRESEESLALLAPDVVRESEESLTLLSPDEVRESGAEVVPGGVLTPEIKVGEGVCGELGVAAKETGCCNKSLERSCTSLLPVALPTPELRRWFSKTFLSAVTRVGSIFKLVSCYSQKEKC